MRVILNPNKDILKDVQQRFNDNSGYCPCRLQKIEDNKCMCKEFRDQIASNIEGPCHCGLYIVTSDE